MSQTPKPKHRVGFLLVWLLVAAGFAWLGWQILNFDSGRPKSKMYTIRSNLIQIERMKQMWASDRGVTGSVQITEQDLAPYAYGYSSNGLVRPVIGERYIIHPLGIGPEAQITRAYKNWPAGTVIRLWMDRDPPFHIILPNHSIQRMGTSRSAASQVVRARRLAPTADADRSATSHSP